MTPPADTWTFGSSGQYTATWDGVDTLTITMTATGAFLESFAGQDYADLNTMLADWASGQPS